MKGYFAAFLLAAQRAFISSESFLLPAGVSAPFFLAGAAFLPADFLRAAQRAFISWESFLRPAGVSWPFFFAGVVGAAGAGPLSLAQRALAAAAKLRPSRRRKVTAARRARLSSSEAYFLRELRKGVFPGYQFVGELKSRLLEL